MSELFGRVARLQLGASGARLREIEGLHIRASVRRAVKDNPDKADITVFNLANESVAELGRSTTIVRLLAGYQTPSEIVVGSVIRDSLEDTYEGADRVTRVQIHDGGVAVREARLSISWARPVMASTVLSYILDQSGLARGSIELGNDIEYSRGFSIPRRQADAIARVADDTNSRIVIQGGAVQAWPRDGERPGRFIVLAADSGLIGSPTRADKGRVRCTTLLQPTIRPGHRVKLEARSLQGTIVVTEVEHVIDTHGADFISRITGRLR